MLVTVTFVHMTGKVIITYDRLMISVNCIQYMSAFTEIYMTWCEDSLYCFSYLVTLNIHSVQTLAHTESKYHLAIKNIYLM
jgi:hypothetical protein